MHRGMSNNLEVDDNEEDDDSREQVCDIGHVVAVKGVLQRPHLPEAPSSMRKAVVTSTHRNGKTHGCEPKH